LFRDLTLTIAVGEFVVLAGASGSGKTTLLNMIGALEPFDAGKIWVGGIDIAVRRHHLGFFREQVGFLFQNFALVENKTVRDNLRLIKRDCATGTSMEEALTAVGLADKLGSKVYTLSGGEQQRVALARLMMKKCQVILADEPTGSLDQANAALVIDILKTMNRQGKTIVLVTHDPEMMQCGDRIIHIQPGLGKTESLDGRTAG
jgi:putative ABC transport system ATP-binding protein